jgi:hypothetical protein
MYLAKSLWLLYAATAFAMPPEYQVNAREGCRQAIAGAYLAAYDEHERAINYIVTLKGQITALKAASVKAQAQAKTAAAALAEHSYDVETARRNDDAASAARVMESQLKEYRTLLDEAQRRVPEVAAREKKLRDQIVKVFNIERADDAIKGGYPFRLNYRSHCPKYRALCPLPEKEREHLIEIKIDGAVPEECQKYAGQSKLR